MLTKGSVAFFDHVRKKKNCYNVNVKAWIVVGASVVLSLFLFHYGMEPAFEEANNVALKSLLYEYDTSRKTLKQDSVTTNRTVFNAPDSDATTFYPSTNSSVTATTDKPLTDWTDVRSALPVTTVNQDSTEKDQLTDIK